MTTDLDTLIRSTLADAADDAPAPGPVLARVRRTSSHRRTWIAAAAVTGVAAATVTGVVLSGGTGGEAPRKTSVATQGSTEPASAAGHRAVLGDASGWTLRYADDDTEVGSVTYEAADGARIDVYWETARSYEDFLVERDPESGESVTVADLPGTMWVEDPEGGNSGGADVEITPDPGLIQTALSEVRDGWFLWVTGQGMTPAEFTEALGDLSRVDQSGLEAALPERFITGAERPDVIRDMLVDVTVPDGFDSAGLTSLQLDRYHVAIDVVDAATCAWIDQWQQGDQAAKGEAVDALEGSEDWPVYVDEIAGTDISETYGHALDQMVAGTYPQDYVDFACGA